MEQRTLNSSRTTISDNDTASLTSASSNGSSIPEVKTRSNNRRRRGRGQRRTAASGQKKHQHPSQTIPAVDQDKYVAMDCEMVGVGFRGKKSVLARVVILNWEAEVALDLYIRPDEPVTDYRTFVSGITSAHLHDAVSLEEAREQVQQVLGDKILIGHGLKNDLHALKITHPWQRTRDTAKYEPFMKVRFDDNVLWPRKLKELCQQKLGREIQVAGQAHSPIEDARAALDLYKHVYAKWEKVMDYKVQKTREIEAARECNKAILEQ